jgi:hypothetical protein
VKREEALTAGEARNIPGGSTTLPAWMPVVENWRNSGSPSCPCPSTAIDPGQLWDRENGQLRATTGPNHRAVILNGCQAETVVGLPWAADSCPWVGKLRTVLPFTVGIRDSAVQLVSVVGWEDAWCRQRGGANTRPQPPPQRMGLSRGAHPTFVPTAPTNHTLHPGCKAIVPKLGSPPLGWCSGQRACPFAQLGIPETGSRADSGTPPAAPLTHSLTG